MVLWRVHLLEYVVLGSLLNAAVGDMIESVVNIGEFSADDCDVLQKVLEIVVDSAPALFTLPEHQLQQNAQEEEEDKNNPQAAALPRQPQIGCRSAGHASRICSKLAKVPWTHIDTWIRVTNCFRSLGFRVKGR